MNPVLDKNGVELNVGDEVAYNSCGKRRYETVSDMGGFGMLWMGDSLFHLESNEVEKVEINPFQRLEEDMRRYVYDRTPERRLKCLDQYRTRLGHESWAESNDEAAGVLLLQPEWEVGDQTT